jgi:hypothetical protein
MSLWAIPIAAFGGETKIAHPGGERFPPCEKGDRPDRHTLQDSSPMGREV